MKENKNKGNNSWPLVGNQQVLGFLEKSIANDRISGSYIFLGPRNLGKSTTAQFFSKSLLCQERNRGEFAPACGLCSSCQQFKIDKKEEGGLADISHPDYYLIKLKEDKKNISIEQVREFIRNLNLSSFANSYKVGVIKNAESLSLEAANALLKTLEEPKNQVIVILIASDLENIPATIVSRSQVLNFYPVESSLIYDHLADDLGVSRGLAKNIAKLALGRPALAHKLLRDEEFLKDHLAQAEAFLDLFPLDINSRLDRMKDLPSLNFSGQAAARNALFLLGIWQGVLRDMLLMLIGNKDLISYDIFKDKIERSLDSANQNKLMELNKHLQMSKDMIAANVSPASVLENFIYNI